jgi:lipoprotein signal peptidase
VKKKGNLRWWGWLIAGIVLAIIHELAAITDKDLVLNKGISFGIRIGGGGWQLGLIILMAGYWVRKGRSLGLGMVVLGGIGNWIDRIRFGLVRDYWYMGVGGLHNNIWDWVVASGLVLYFYSLWKKSK